MNDQGGLARKVVRYELRMWRDLFRWTFRRPPPIGPGARAFGYTKAVMPVHWAFIIVSAIEIPAVHLLLPWETARRVADVLGVWGLLWMIGILAGLRIHPHVVSDAGLRVRRGNTIDFTIPWEAIASIRRNNRMLPSSRIQFDRNGSHLALNLGQLSQSNVDVVLERPLALPLPDGPSDPVTELRLHADDPDGLVSHARERAAGRLAASND